MQGMLLGNTMVQLDMSGWGGPQCVVSWRKLTPPLLISFNHLSQRVNCVNKHVTNCGRKYSNTLLTAYYVYCSAKNKHDISC